MPYYYFRFPLERAWLPAHLVGPTADQVGPGAAGPPYRPAYGPCRPARAAGGGGRLPLPGHRARRPVPRQGGAVYRPR